MNAEERFLSHLKELHLDFPNLRIVLEHASTKAAVDMVSIHYNYRSDYRHNYYVTGQIFRAQCSLYYHRSSFGIGR